MENQNLNIKPNQNLIGLMVGLISLGTAEYFCLKRLLISGIIITIMFSGSVFITLIAYTITYCNKKIKKING